MTAKKNSSNTELEQAWKSLQDAPSYFERYQTTAQLDQNDPKFASQLFCLSRGFWIDDETHECGERRVA